MILNLWDMKKFNGVIMKIREFVSGLDEFHQVNCIISDSVINQMKVIIIENSFEAMMFFEEVILNINNGFYDDVFLVNLLKCLGAASLESWVDDILVLALSRNDIDVRDAAAITLDFRGRYDLIRQHQSKVPWMRNYIESIMLSENG